MRGKDREKERKREKEGEKERPLKHAKQKGAK